MADPFTIIRRKARQRRHVCALAGGLLFSVLLHCAAIASPTKEQQIKAAFLYNFTKFVEWPPAEFPDASSPIVVGVFESDPIGAELEQVVRNRKVNGRDVVVKILAGDGDLAEVHVVFVRAGEEERFRRARGTLQKSAVLTVGESPQFSSLGGIITFVPDAGKIRFEIDIDAAKRSSVKVSAELQKLARTVRRNGS